MTPIGEESEKSEAELAAEKAKTKGPRPWYLKTEVLVTLGVVAFVILANTIQPIDNEPSQKSTSESSKATQEAAPPKPDLAPIRDVIVEQLQIIRRSSDFNREQHIVAMLLFLTAKLDILRTNQVQLNAYRRIAELYAREGIFAFAAAFDFLVASA
jgi:hypothetical protein